MKNSNKNIFEAFFKSTAYAIFSLSLFTTHAIAANITVLCSTALLEPLSALIPEFELATGHKVAIAFKTTKGIVEQVRGGDGADIIIVGRDAAVDLEKTGKLFADYWVITAFSFFTLTLQ